MKNKILGLGVIGCGDFLRLQTEGIRRSGECRVVGVYDPDSCRAAAASEVFGGCEIAASPESLIARADVGVAAIFVPPWARRPLVERAAAAGKHILTTKPLASSMENCDAMVDAVTKAGVRCGVIYNRTEDSRVETLRQVAQSGRFGAIALYKQDWMHHYPSWNAWALDPEKNGGPFMDAMIHNLNIARYLTGTPAVKATFFADRHAHPDLRCADTEFLKIDFEGNRSAHLFITWAADMEVYSIAGNHREHIDIWYAVTDQGWRVFEDRERPGHLCFSRDGKKEFVPVVPMAETPVQRLARSIFDGSPLDGILPSIEEAREDIRILKVTGQSPGSAVSL